MNTILIRNEHGGEVSCPYEGRAFSLAMRLVLHEDDSQAKVEALQWFLDGTVGGITIETINGNLILNVKRDEPIYPYDKLDT